MCAGSSSKLPGPPRSALFPYTTLFRSLGSRRSVPALRAITSAVRISSRTCVNGGGNRAKRSEEHTSELQSLRHLVCRLLLEKKKEMTSLATRLRKHAARHCNRDTFIRR